MNVRHSIEAAGGLVTLRGAAVRCGVSPQAMHNYSRIEGFPEEVPFDGTARITLYLGGEIEQWFKDYRSGLSPYRAARAPKALDQFERRFG